MDETAFWMIIERYTGEPENKKAKAIQAHLETLPPENIIAFQDIFDDKRDLPEELIVVANLIKHHGDDGTHYGFAPWLVFQGKETYTRAVKYPGLLGRNLSEEQLRSKMENEQLMDVATKAYKRRTGKEMEPWWDREVKKMYPHLSKKDVQEAMRVAEVVQGIARNTEEPYYLVADLLLHAKNGKVQDWFNKYSKKK